METPEEETLKTNEERNLLHHSKEPILSAEELIKVYNISLDRKLNLNTLNSATDSIEIDKGEKINNPTGTWLESKRVEARLRNLRKQVSVPKVAQKGQLSEAIWDNTLKKARVTKPCGKQWTVMGHIYENNLYLHSEEALFLLECNNLELMYDNIAMSLQQAFQLLILDKRGDCTLESYLTYGKLMRLGYKVVRHQRNLRLSNKQVAKNPGKTIPDQECRNQRERQTYNASSIREKEFTDFSVKTSIVQEIEPEFDNNLISDTSTDNSEVTDVKQSIEDVDLECENTSNNFRVCLNQPGPSSLGDIVGEESSNSKITYTDELIEDDERMQYLNQNVVLSSLSCDSKSRQNHLLCNTIVEQLIGNVICSISKTHIERNEKNFQKNLAFSKSKTCLNDTTGEMESFLITHNGKLGNSSKSNANNSSMTQEEPEIEVLSDDEICRLDAMSMMPNCYNRSKITLTVPPLDLLPHRSWPKKKVYIIEIRRPNLFEVSLSDLESNKSEDIRNSAAILTMDDDIEIIDVIPSKSFQRNKASEDSRENEYSPKNAPCDNIDSHQSLSCNIIPFDNSVTDVNASKKFTSNLDFQNQNTSELRKLVYNKMIGKLGNSSSRGFYRDSECLKDPTTKKLNVSRKRLRLDATVDKLENAEKKHALDDNVELDFRPSKRFPITRQDQCLPCDATWFSDMLMHNKQDKLKRDALGMTYSKEQKDSNPQFINCPSNRPNRDYNKCKELYQSKWHQHKSQKRFMQGLQHMHHNVIECEKSKCSPYEASSSENVQFQETHCISDEIKVTTVVHEDKNVEYITTQKATNEDICLIAEHSKCGNDNQSKTRGANIEHSLVDSCRKRCAQVFGRSKCDNSGDNNETKLPLSLIDGPLAKIWGGKTKPLLQPIDAKSTAKVMSKLDLQLDKINRSKLVAYESNKRSTRVCPFKIQFDVYLPKVPFRKSCPRSPNYRIAVCKTVDTLPTHEDVEALTRLYSDAVPLLFSVCSISSVSFYCFSKIHLPLMISKG